MCSEGARSQTIFIQEGMNVINASEDMDAAVARGFARLRNRGPDAELHERRK